MRGDSSISRKTVIKCSQAEVGDSSGWFQEVLDVGLVSLWSLVLVSSLPQVGMFFLLFLSIFSRFHFLLCVNYSS